MTASTPQAFLPWLDPLRERGFAFAPGTAVQAALKGNGQLTDWAAFAESWNDLHVDPYMADHGRYRRRRHAVFAIDAAGAILRQPHQAHYQTLEYNPLHGDLQRWFEPVLPAVAGGDSLHAVLGAAHGLFQAQRPQTRDWRVEVHQFRIEASAEAAGQPTPEGMHRDGVDGVVVLMIRRRNIAAGTTTIHDLSRQEIGSFTLVEPFDLALVDDHRCFHGVTAVTALDPALPAYRDVLVVTFRAAVAAIDTAAGPIMPPR
jgi:hypothetical protein